MTRLRSRWWIVAASVFGVMCGGGPINIFTFGVFLRPVTEDLHIGRGVFASAMLVTNWISAVSGPFLGYLLDRYGARRVMLISTVLFTIAVASQYYLTASLLVIYLLFAFKGLLGSGLSPVSFAFVVAKWFDRRRGFALGIAMSGVGLGTAIVPLYTAYLIGAFGWRWAYVGLAAFVLVVAGISVTFFIREPGADETVPEPIAVHGALPGVSLKEALLSRRFWGLAFAFVLGVVALNGTLTQIVAMLLDRGYALPAATSVLSVSGIAAVAGRLLSGWCVDRFRGAHVAVGFFILPMIGTVLLGSGAGGYAPVLGAILCGAALGAEIDLMGFFVSRYFGLKAYGKIVGTMFGIFAGATGVGPYLSGLSFDRYHSYVPAFAFYEVILVTACVVFLRLGPYPFPAQRRSGPAVREAEVPA